jgi:hypothetical protein
MRREAAQAYQEGLETAEGFPELDVLTQQEVVEALDPYREDPLLNPWRRGYNAGMRAVLDN